jgi:hypothetical protein
MVIFSFYVIFETIPSSRFSVSMWAQEAMIAKVGMAKAVRIVFNRDIFTPFLDISASNMLAILRLRIFMIPSDKNQRSIMPRCPCKSSMYLSLQGNQDIRLIVSR